MAENRVLDLPRMLPAPKIGTPHLTSRIQSFENAFKIHSGCLPNWPRPPLEVSYWSRLGTTIADRPPHRSVRARLRIRLLLRMNGVEAVIGMRMQDAGCGVEESTGPSMGRDAPIGPARVGCDVPEYFSRVGKHGAGMNTTEASYQAPRGIGNNP
jgi:hypothetical protein